MTLTTSTNFDSGGAVDTTIDDPNNHIDLTHDDPHGYNSPFLHFRLEGRAGKTVSFEITDLADVRMPLDYHLMYSDDPSPTGWQRFDESAGGGWSHTFSSDEVYIASWHPYPYSDIVNRVNELSRHDLVTTEVIGQSQQGRDMHAIRISDPGVPDSDQLDLVNLTRQHPGETQGSFRMDAAIDYVLDTLEGSGFQNDYTFHFIPALNPDGIYDAIHRLTPDGTDLNRQWNTASPTEVANVKDYVRNNCDKIHWGFDFHSSTSSGFVATEYYSPVADSDDEAWFIEISSQNLSLSGTSGITEASRSHGFFGEELGYTTLITEAWTYYEYSVAEMEQEAVSSMQVVR